MAVDLLPASTIEQAIPSGSGEKKSALVNRPGFGPFHDPATK